MTKAITIWQPYAAAIACGLKRFETRGWATKYRGPLIIHASMRAMDAARRKLAEKYGLLDAARHTGEFVAVCKLTDCIEMTPEFITGQCTTEREFGIWEPGRYAWKLEHVRALPAGYKIPGRQGLWDAPDISEIFLFDTPDI